MTDQCGIIRYDNSMCCKCKKYTGDSGNFGGTRLQCDHTLCTKCLNVMIKNINTCLYHNFMMYFVNQNN